MTGFGAGLVVGIIAGLCIAGIIYISKKRLEERCFSQELRIGELLCDIRWLKCRYAIKDDKDV